jgi:hypothetical protein
MATTSHPAPAAPHDPFKDNPKYDAEKDPNPDVHLVSQEQLKRSEEIEKVGVDAWMAAHDTRTAEEKKANTVVGLSVTHSDGSVTQHGARR